MDAGISGDYPAIMRFINSLERDQIFFIIRAMSLTGQQGGLVNLRLRVSTWLRPADAEPAACPSLHPGAESPAASRRRKGGRIIMALALGTENKRQVILASVLGVVLVICGVWVLSHVLWIPSAVRLRSGAGRARAQSARPAAAQSGATPSSPAAGNEAQRLTNAGIDPALHFDKLAQSEDVDTPARAATSSPPIPSPFQFQCRSRCARNGRNLPPPSTPPAPPKPPAIDLRYFGYSQDEHKVLKAFFIHGDDIFMARTGDIVDHRYKVGAIHPLNVEVTDLAYNNTQDVEFRRMNRRMTSVLSNSPHLHHLRDRGCPILSAASRIAQQESAATNARTPAKAIPPLRKAMSCSSPSSSWRSS